MLTALNNQRPDRLPCQVHSWMGYYLRNFLGGIDDFQAYEKFGMDFAIYATPDYRYAATDLDNWRVQRIDRGLDTDGNHAFEEIITTPGGILRRAGAWNDFTTWTTEHLLKSVADFELFDRYYPVPTAVDFSNMRRLREKLGDRGILRTHPFSPGQGSPWQSFCIQFGTAEAILLAYDDPASVHFILNSMLQKSLRAASMWEGTPADLIEVGGGAGSSTVISPDFYREFGLPYDQKQNALFRQTGLKVVNHFCGGLMPMLDLVVESGANGLETMTPRSMGGDCDLREASRRVGDKLFFVGGFDQNAGFENGTPEKVRKQVFACFEATRDYAGYIIAPSDHFFKGDPANLQAFANACKECAY